MAPQLISVIGSLNTDIITRTSRVPAAGETIITQSYDTGSGGKGANQAVACARLSRRRGEVQAGDVNVQMIGAVGDDAFGSDLIQNLKADGIDVGGVQVKQGEKTGVAVIIVDDESGENRILMSPNANYSLRREDFFSIRPPLPSLIVLQLEIPIETTLQILKTAQGYGIEVLLNPAPAQQLPQEAYAAVTHLIVNETEAGIITDTTHEKPIFPPTGQRVKRLIKLGVWHIVVTHGAKGVVYMDTHQQQREMFPAEKVKVVDTTAAGDTFVGAYAFAITHYLKGKRDFKAMTTAIKWANRAAAKTVQQKGAQSAIPWQDSVPEFVEATAEGGFGFYNGETIEESFDLAAELT